MLAAGLFLVSMTSCERESRSFKGPAPSATASDEVPYTSPVRPGPQTRQAESSRLPVQLAMLSHEPYGSQFAKNATANSSGQWLFGAFNCSGCHANGGGGMGPPLMDSEWFYGSAPDDVYQSIVEGRPNGMPSFRGRIPDQQVWQLVTYVRSLSGLVNSNAASGRSEHMSTRPPPNSISNAPPKVVPAPTTGPSVGRSTGLVPTPTATAPATQP